MLDEVELLIGSRHPEVVADDLEVVTGLAAIRADHRDAGLAAERRVREHNGVPSARVGSEGVSHGDERVSIGLPDAVEQHVHGRQARSAVDELRAADEVVAQVFALILCQILSASRREGMGCKEEASRPAGGVDDGVVRRGLDAVDHCGDEGSGCEVLAGPD